MMERRHVPFESYSNGYDALNSARRTRHEHTPDLTVSPSDAYDEYFTLHKSLVTPAMASRLEDISTSLATESHPDQLNVAAWAAAEVALVDESRRAIDRHRLLRSAERYWQRALEAQEVLNHSGRDYLQEDVASFRIALSLAYVPMMQALIVGNVTSVIRERTFVDVLRIAQTAGVQRELAYAEHDENGVGDMIGFEHECNAHLALLYMDDPRYLPLPSTARGGSGYDHPKETHDVMVINQHWGNVLKMVPVEVKSKASLNDLKRYEALIVRGKMHLSTAGRFTPNHTRQSFAACYDGTPTKIDQQVVTQVTDTMKQLLQLYQLGERQAMAHDGRTRFHETMALERERPEFSLRRPHKY